MIKEGVLARQGGELFLFNRLLSDAVVAGALGMSNCPTSDAEPTMFKTMQQPAPSSAAATDEACVGAPQGR